MSVFYWVDRGFSLFILVLSIDGPDTNWALRASHWFSDKQISQQAFDRLTSNSAGRAWTFCTDFNHYVYFTLPSSFFKNGVFSFMYICLIINKMNISSKLYILLMIKYIYTKKETSLKQWTWHCWESNCQKLPVRYIYYLNICTESPVCVRSHR